MSDSGRLRSSGYVILMTANGQKPPYVTAFENDKAGAHVMYCTNAVSTRRALPYLAVVCIPDRLTVRSA